MSVLPVRPFSNLLKRTWNFFIKLLFFDLKYKDGVESYSTCWRMFSITIKNRSFIIEQLDFAVVL